MAAKKKTTANKTTSKRAAKRTRKASAKRTVARTRRRANHDRKKAAEQKAVDQAKDLLAKINALQAAATGAIADGPDVRPIKGDPYQVFWYPPQADPTTEPVIFWAPPSLRATRQWTERFADFCRDRLKGKRDESYDEIEDTLVTFSAAVVWDDEQFRYRSLTRQERADPDTVALAVGWTNMAFEINGEAVALEWPEDGMQEALDGGLISGELAVAVAEHIIERVSSRYGALIHLSRELTSAVWTDEKKD